MEVLVGAQTCRDFERSSRMEWLEANGLGGYAGGTVSGLESVMLNTRIDDRLIVEGLEVALSSTRSGKRTGYRYLTSFRLDPFPTWTYDIGSTRIEKRIFMTHGRQAAVVEYEVCGIARDCKLEVRPLLACDSPAYSGAFEWEAQGILSVRAHSAMPRIYLGAESRACIPTGVRRAEDCVEPFLLYFELDESPRAVVVVSHEAIDAREALSMREQERGRRMSLRRTAPSNEAKVADLAEMADRFVVNTDEGYQIVPEYGREPGKLSCRMAALPGLTLPTGRYGVARKILDCYRPANSPEEETLWYIEASRAFLQYTGDDGFVRRELYPRMTQWAGSRKKTDGALWYNALRGMEFLARRYGDDSRAAEWDGRARRIASYGKDKALAAGLHYSMLNDAEARTAVDGPEGATPSSGSHVAAYARAYGKGALLERIGDCVGFIPRAWTVSEALRAVSEERIRERKDSLREVRPAVASATAKRQVTSA